MNCMRLDSEIGLILCNNLHRFENVLLAYHLRMERCIENAAIASHSSCIVHTAQIQHGATKSLRATMTNQSLQSGVSNTIVGLPQVSNNR